MRCARRNATSRTRNGWWWSIEAVVVELRSYLLGWKQYFRLAETPKVLRELDKWIRHRLRMVQLKQWKRGRTVYRELRNLGAPETLAAAVAANSRRWWKNAGHLIAVVFPISYYTEKGVPRLAG
jgi:hypothetical protein